MKRDPSARLLPALLYGILMAVGLFSTFHHGLLSGGRAWWIGGLDTRLNHYFLEHSYRVAWSEGYAGRLWSPPCFYPAEEVLALSDNLLGFAPAYWLLRSAFEPADAFQLWTMSAMALCFLCMAGTLRALGIAHLPCALGGFLFAFGMPRVEQYFQAHQQLMPQFFSPLALLAAWRFLRRPSSLALNAALGLVVLQLLAGIYLGWFLALGLAAFALLACLASVEIRRRCAGFCARRWPIVLGSLAAWGWLSWLFLAPYARAGRGQGGWPRDLVSKMQPCWNSWLRPGTGTAWWPVLSPLSDGLPFSTEHHLFLGVTAWIVVALAGVIAVRSRAAPGDDDTMLARVALGTGAALVLVSLNLGGGWSAWGLVYALVPGASAIRAVTRIVLVVELFLLAGGLYLLDRRLAASGLRPWATSSIMAVLLAAAVGEQLRLDLGPGRPTAFEEEASEMALLMRLADVSYVIDMQDRPFEETEMLAMWAGLEANCPVINGYTARAPIGYPRRRRLQTPETLADWLGPDVRGTLAIVGLRDDATAWMATYREALPGAILGRRSSGRFAALLVSWPPAGPVGPADRGARPPAGTRMIDSSMPNGTFQIPELISE